MTAKSRQRKHRKKFKKENDHVYTEAQSEERRRKDEIDNIVNGARLVGVSFTKDGLGSWEFSSEDDPSERTPIDV